MRLLLYLWSSSIQVDSNGWDQVLLKCDERQGDEDPEVWADAYDALNRHLAEYNLDESNGKAAQ